MSDTQTCKYCQSTIPAAAVTCPVCRLPLQGALVFTPSGMLGMPALFGMPTPGADLVLGMPPDLPKPPDLSQIGLDFYSLRVLRGQVYRPVFALTPTEPGGFALDAPFAVHNQPEGHFLLVDGSGAQVRVSLFDAIGRLSKVICTVTLGEPAPGAGFPITALDRYGNLTILAPDVQTIIKISGDHQEEIKLQSPLPGEAQGLALDDAGNLYLAAAGSHHIQVCTPGGQVSGTIGQGELDDPCGIALDSHGNLFVADASQHCIHKFTSECAHAASFGQPGELAAQFSAPFKVRLDAADHLYVADCTGERIQKFDPQGGFIYQLWLPEHSGGLADFEIHPSGKLLVALPMINLVLGLEIA